MSSASKEKTSIWTPANVVTVIRICGVPLFVVALLSPWPAWFPAWPDAEFFKPLVAAIVFAVLAATDGVDGYLARSRNEVTTFGKFIDPLADKILVAAALMALIELQTIPSWVAMVILSREFIVSGLRMIAASENVVIAASWYGKAKTVTQIIAILLFLVKDTFVPEARTDPSNPLYIFAWVVMIVALVLTIVSMLDYFAKCMPLLGLGSNADADSEGKQEAGASEVPASVPSEEELYALAADVISEAQSRGVQVGTAESLTGGMICTQLTAVPGSSSVVRGSVASYSCDVKRDVLGVPQPTLDAEGAVCEAVARQMAKGAADVLQADCVVAVTGIAGPGGAEPGKPVGTVWMGVYARGSLDARLLHFEGDRAAVRAQTTACALRALKAAVTG